MLQLQQSMRDEVRQTVAYVVSHRDPIDALFLANQTWRDREVETFRVTQVIEDITWTYHRFPDRVGIGVCAGALPVDFEMAGVPFEEMFPRYRAALADLVAALGGKAQGPIAADV